MPPAAVEGREVSPKQQGGGRGRHIFGSFCPARLLLTRAEPVSCGSWTLCPDAAQSLLSYFPLELVLCHCSLCRPSACPSGRHSRATGGPT